MKKSYSLRVCLQPPCHNGKRRPTVALKLNRSTASLRPENGPILLYQQLLLVQPAPGFELQNVEPGGQLADVKLPRAGPAQLCLADLAAVGAQHGGLHGLAPGQPAELHRVVGRVGEQAHAKQPAGFSSAGGHPGVLHHAAHTACTPAHGVPHRICREAEGEKLVALGN